MSAFRGMGSGSFQKDESVLKHKLAQGTVRRSWQLVKPYAGILAFFLTLVVLDAAVGVINPLIFRRLINQGILPGNPTLVIHLALLACAVSLVDSGLTFWQRHLAAHIGF